MQRPPRTLSRRTFDCYCTAGELSARGGEHAQEDEAQRGRQARPIHCNEEQARRGGCEADPSLRRQPSDRERRTARPRYRPISRPCRAGKATSGAVWTRSSSARSPAYARPSNGNSPFYGVEGQGWFLSFHTFTNYVKVTFFRGTSLRPIPPGASKHKEVRYLDIRENELR